MFIFVCYLSGQVRTDADSASLGSHLEGEADHSFDLQKSLLTQASLVLDERNTISVNFLAITTITTVMHRCVSVSLLTVLSSPWMCRVTDFAFLLEELMKNWDFFLPCLSAMRGTGLAGALRMSNTSWAKAVMSTDT